MESSVGQAVPDGIDGNLFNIPGDSSQIVLKFEA